MIQMDFSLVEGAFVAKRIITILLALLGALLAAALAYVAYVMITYERLPDNLALVPVGEVSGFMEAMDGLLGYRACREVVVGGPGVLARRLP